MSYRANILNQEHTIADEIFCDIMIRKYESGEIFYVELYNDTNRLFPGKYKEFVKFDMRRD